MVVQDAGLLDNGLPEAEGRVSTISEALPDGAQEESLEDLDQLPKSENDEQQDEHLVHLLPVDRDV